jgi:hypothetical protein
MPIVNVYAFFCAVRPVYSEGGYRLPKSIEAIPWQSQRWVGRIEAPKGTSSSKSWHASFTRYLNSSYYAGYHYRGTTLILWVAAIWSKTFLWSLNMSKAWRMHCRCNILQSAWSMHPVSWVWAAYEWLAMYGLGKTLSYRYCMYTAGSFWDISFQSSSSGVLIILHWTHSGVIFPSLFSSGKGCYLGQERREDWDPRWRDNQRPGGQLNLYSTRLPNVFFPPSFNI